MMFAARKLQGIGLIMLLTLCTLVAYPISLRVSATRAELNQVRAEIAQVRQQNRMLEGDIAVLANVRQLDRWNSEFLGYVAPSAGQYLPGERALASLDTIRPAHDTPAQPVLVAMRTEVDSAPQVARAAPAEMSDAADDDGASTEQSAPRPRQFAMADRQAVTASAVRDIARVMPVNAEVRGSVR